MALAEGPITLPDVGTALMRGAQHADQAALNRQTLAKNALVLEEAERAAAASRSLPSDLASLVAASPEVRTVTPGQPAVPPSLSTVTTGPPEIDAEGIERGAPSITTATPGQPATDAVTVEGTTMGTLVKQLGPETVARLMKTPEGQKALAAKGLMSEEAMNQRARVAKARDEFKGFRERAEQAMLNGDAVGSLMIQARAWERIAEATEDPTKAQFAYRQAGDLQKRALDLQTDKEEAVKAGADFTRIATARAAYVENPSSETLQALYTAYAEATSKEGRQLRDRAYQNMAGADFKNMENPRLSAWAALVAEHMNKQVADGKAIPDLAAAQREVFRAHPELAAAVLADALRKKGTIDKSTADLLFGRSTFTKEEYRVAQMLTERIDGLSLDDQDPARAKQAAQRFLEHLKTIEKAARQNINSADQVMYRFQMAQLRQSRDRASTELEKLRSELNDPKKVFVWRQRPADAEAMRKKITDLEDQIAATDRILREEGLQAAPKPAAAPAAPAAPQGKVQDGKAARQKALEIRDRLVKSGVKNPEELKRRVLEELKKLGFDPAARYSSPSPR